MIIEIVLSCLMCAVIANVVYLTKDTIKLFRLLEELNKDLREYKNVQNSINENAESNFKSIQENFTSIQRQNKTIDTQIKRNKQENSDKFRRIEYNIENKLGKLIVSNKSDKKFTPKT